MSPANNCDIVTALLSPDLWYNLRQSNFLCIGAQRHAHAHTRTKEYNRHSRSLPKLYVVMVIGSANPSTVIRTLNDVDEVWLWRTRRTEADCVRELGLTLRSIFDYTNNSVLSDDVMIWYHCYCVLYRYPAGLFKIVYLYWVSVDSYRDDRKIKYKIWPVEVTTQCWQIQ